MEGNRGAGHRLSHQPTHAPPGHFGPGSERMQLARVEPDLGVDGREPDQHLPDRFAREGQRQVAVECGCGSGAIHGGPGGQQVGAGEREFIADPLVRVDALGNFEITFK